MLRGWKIILTPKIAFSLLINLKLVMWFLPLYSNSVLKSSGQIEDNIIMPEKKKKRKKKERDQSIGRISKELHTAAVGLLGVKRQQHQPKLRFGNDKTTPWRLMKTKKGSCFVFVFFPSLSSLRIISVEWRKRGEKTNKNKTMLCVRNKNMSRCLHIPVLVICLHAEVGIN